jgi:subfamily B ATP-binding cassette protein HlyB/CyaB
MPRHFLRAVATRLSSGTWQTTPSHTFSVADVIWAMGSFCALNRKPFDATLLVQQFPPPYSADSLIHAGRAMGFRIKRKDCDSLALFSLNLPCLVVMSMSDADNRGTAASVSLDDADVVGASPAPCKSRPAIVVQIADDNVVLFEAGTNTPKTLTRAEFAACYVGTAFQLALESKVIKDPDGAAGGLTQFGFKWFIPELLKHKRVWRDVLIASLIIQLLALGAPLFTQVVIDKVVVHRTQSTLIVIAVGLGVFMLFTMLLSWVRQYLVLDTGNRVDAVLGSAVFSHLFKLPPRYFEHRPTGVIAARLHGVETIREFVASAAVTLILDLPFLLTFVGIMLYYSVNLTIVALALVSGIVLLSLLVAPIFRARLNRQFLLAARNQAFITEYVSGLETVKSLQMEPQLTARYSDYLAECLQAGFRMRQIANTYSVAANGLEQLMSLLILVVGAYTVMNNSDFTIGMLIAFQMFAGRVSQPMLRLVGLWQQFQQANLSVQRLGDIMNAPTEPYSILPSRLRESKGKIEIADLSFRYGENLPYLYQGFSLTVQPGKVVAIMGASGCGKSTLAKLLQGFYIPTAGQIKLDGNDIRHLSANELAAISAWCRRRLCCSPAPSTTTC